MRESIACRTAAVFASLLAVVSALPAQGRQVYQNASEGYRVAVSKVIKAVPNVSQTLGLSKAEFQKMGLGSRDVPNCP